MLSSLAQTSVNDQAVDVRDNAITRRLSRSLIEALQLRLTMIGSFWGGAGEPFFAKKGSPELFPPAHPSPPGGIAMRVAMYYNNRDVRVEQMEIPRIGPDELLVKVWSSGICGSDVLEWYRLAKAPLVLGHEIAGEIVQVGDAVQGWKQGDRVFVSHHVPCNLCRYCASGHHSVCDTLAKTNFEPGGFAEYLRVPAINVRNGVYALPDSMSYDEAVFIEPLACVFRGQHHAGWMPGRRVLVIGSWHRGDHARNAGKGRRCQPRHRRGCQREQTRSRSGSSEPTMFLRQETIWSIGSKKSMTGVWQNW